jgi:hypothetical protein
MPMQVVNGATLACSFGLSPSSLVVLPINRTQVNSQSEATIQDHVPMLNIQPFGMCTSPSNPQVIAATAAALGVFTPQPCIPLTLAPWVPGAPTVQIVGPPALDDSSQCTCMWMGTIAVVNPGQTSTQIP